MIHPLKSLLSLNFTSVQSKEHVPAFISFSLKNFTDVKTFELRNLQISYLMVEGGDDEEELEDPYQGGLPTCTVAKCPLFYTQYFQTNLFESTQSSLRKPNLTGNFLKSIFHFSTFCNPPHLLTAHPGVLQSWQQTVARISEKGCARLYLCSLVLVLACTCARLYLYLLVLVIACTCARL